MNRLGFATHRNKGFTITFENGHTASVQFGWMNYCEAGKASFASSIADPEARKATHHSSDAEVASWDKDGNWTTRAVWPGIDDDVVGYLGPSDVLKFLNAVAALPTQE